MNTDENRPVVKAMCQQWQPVMQGLMKAEWPGPTPPLWTEKTADGFIVHFNEMDWGDAAPAFENATSRFQPNWTRISATGYRFQLIKLMRYALMQKSPNTSLRRAARVLNYHLRRNAIKIWRTKLAVPFLEENRFLPRYRQVTRVQIDPLGAVMPRDTFKDVFLKGAYFYIVSLGRPRLAEIGADSAHARYMFLFRGQPYYLTPFVNSIVAADTGAQVWPPTPYIEYQFSSVCYLD